ncbi:hypothetical protein ODJ79_21435 [Actinoplanes sp. KI2]|uniref:hypothetical protein n=1 Tax=Actinoplanes sp. KI2 TaxID=2983315 RepID=UPI0021D5DB70|nr:hypothetical protein [Actinoplanes sp. KI2]MCU7726300.1 hypothetical protein [Actinoplanes sp. KI2]
MFVRSLAAAVTIAAALIAPPVAGASAAPARTSAVFQERAPFPGAPRLAPASQAGALRLCSGQHAAEYGDWRNADPATRSITRAQVRDCQSVTTCTGDVCSTTSDAGWAVRLFGACSPTDCDWGWSAGAFRLANGRIPAFYDQGFAKRQVWVAMSQFRPGQLWIAIRTDFVDPNRADYESQDWFVRS